MTGSVAESIAPAVGLPGLADKLAPSRLEKRAVLRSVPIGLRLTCCFALIMAIVLLGAAAAIWQMSFYNREVEKLRSIDRRMISVLKVNNQVLAFRETIYTAAMSRDGENLRRVMLPFRAKFLQETGEAGAALQESVGSGGSTQRAIYTLLAYQTAIPRHIDAILELAEFSDWQAIQYQLETQVLQTGHVLAHVVGEMELQANSERKLALENMTAIRRRILGVLPMGSFLLLLTAGGLLGARVTQSIADPLRHMEMGARALESGAFSHRLPVNGHDELTTVAVAFNRAVARIERLHSGLETLVVERTADLQLANEALRKLSSQDPLTGIANRRIFDQTLERELSKSAETRAPVSLLMVDVDHFKGLNDHYGHQRGDECLLEVVRTMKSIPLRANDLIARYGGEEFGVVLTETGESGAKSVAERMRHAVETLAIPNCGSPELGRLSISIGSATVYPEDGLIPFAALIERADRALYQAKQNGRNCVMAA